MAITDLVFKTAVSFGCFLVMPLPFDEYIFFITENIMANETKGTHIEERKKHSNNPSIVNHLTGSLLSRSVCYNEGSCLYWRENANTMSYFKFYLAIICVIS
jgi:hypothetical protein